jgi:peroxiredoxin
MVGRHPEQKEDNQTLWNAIRPFSNSIYYYALYFSGMKKLIICLVIVPIVFNCAKTEKKTEEFKEERTVPVAPKTVKSEIPDLWVILEDGTRQSTRTLRGKTMIFLFQPDCDHCQREAVDLEKHIAHFKDYQLYFISSAPMPEILKFAEDYKLRPYENLHWATTTAQNVISNFGPIDAPSVYLYSEAGKLIEKFNGEVAVEVILKYL